MAVLIGKLLKVVLGDLHECFKAIEVLVEYVSQVGAVGLGAPLPWRRIQGWRGLLRVFAPPWSCGR